MIESALSISLLNFFETYSYQFHINRYHQKDKPTTLPIILALLNLSTKYDIPVHAPSEGQSEWKMESRPSDEGAKPKKVLL